MTSQSDHFHARSLEEPQKFWAEAAQDIHWYKTWDTVLDDSRKPFYYRWFVGGEVNTCYNTLDRHVENGRAGQVALVECASTSIRLLVKGSWPV
jgi:propionyl-CoA synthetase